MKPFQGLLITLGVLGLALAGPGSTHPAAAAVPHIIVQNFEGAAHHKAVASQENVPIGFHFNSLPQPGAFTATLNDVPITGVRTTGGHITFSGQTTISGFTLKILNGQGQFSATGFYLDGSFTLAGTVQPSPNGFYNFESAIPLGPAPPAPASFQPSGGERHAAAAPVLDSEYDGHAHHLTNVNLDSVAVFFDFSVVHADGSFKGIFGSTPIHGKIKKNGHLTFQGKASFGTGTFAIHGQAQRSATGLFLLGQFTVVGTGSQAAATGQYFFETNAV